ncbi:MAG: fused MFS/spermidine synthase [Deltaproteobacteria bacterium]|jgi:spermidine synthase|nr:fused MFS/spermidine synthase [Deltaproteobacteria bacterium]
MLALVMFLNGLAIMVLEMVGARLLAPELGTSTVVWTSLIGVILASLSAGYWFGGKLADAFLAGDGNPAEARRRDRAHAVLALILLAASCSVLFTALVHNAVLRQLSQAPLSLYSAALCAAVLLFALPGVLCGMVSPYATRLAITSSETSGSVIGRLNAISTVGSIAGAFLGGFVLISWFGSREITLAVAACLLLASVLVRVRPLLPRIFLALVLAGLGTSAHFDRLNAEGEALAFTLETPYSSIRILTQPYLGRTARLLLTNPGSCQSGCYLDQPEDLIFEYTRFYALGPYLNPKASRILMLGGGGYSIPKWMLAGKSALASAEFALDVVELDPGMTRAAEDYFFLPPKDPRLRIFHEDARRFLNRAAQTMAEGKNPDGAYQLIFVDVFNSFYSVPFHVGTREAAREMHALLTDDGMLILNVISALEGDGGRLFRSILQAFAAVFPEIRVFAVSAPYHGAEVQNIILLAFKTPRPLPDLNDPAVPEAIASLLRRQWQRPIASDCPALTDNYAPVERYALSLTR